MSHGHSAPAHAPAAGHGAEPAHDDGIDAASLGAAFGIGIAIVAVTILAGQALYYVFNYKWEQDRYYSKPDTKKESVLAGQRATMEGYRWVDKEKGVVAVPIERAMELVLKERAASAPQTPKGKDY